MIIFTDNTYLISDNNIFTNDTICFYLGVAAYIKILSGFQGMFSPEPHTCTSMKAFTKAISAPFGTAEYP
jgi:hypothetical protein